MVHVPSRPGQLTALACAGIAALAGCGDEGTGGSEGPALAWVKDPVLVRQPELPRDRIAVGRVRNRSGHTLRLTASRARVVDQAGRSLQSSVRFSSAYGHGLYSYEQQPKEGDPEFQQRRLGELAVIPAGRTAPLTVSWRLPAARRVRAARVRIGKLALPLPDQEG